MSATSSPEGGETQRDEEETVDAPTLPDSVLLVAAREAGTTALTDEQLAALIPKLPWEDAGAKAMQWAVKRALGPKGETDAEDHESE